MKLSEDLQYRGLIKDASFKDVSWLDEPRTFYHGVDASADSLTIGNLAALMMARRLAEAGWKTVLLVGGGTSLVGDPGGKTDERQLKSREEIVKNITGIRAQVTKLFAGKNYEMVDNYDWLASLKYVDFLRDVGKHFSMTELMQRDFVTDRMNEGGSGISYAEFSYSLIQGYDFWHLYKDHGVVVQIGGSDQWGNMLSGVSLIRKKEGAQAHALSMPLIVNKETGQKFGKSEVGAVWLDPAKTSPTQFYQFWINTNDSDVEEYLKVFTTLPKEEIEKTMAAQREHPEQRTAQTLLAKEVTALVHGQSNDAESSTKYLTSQGSLSNATDEDLSGIRQQLPSVKTAADGSVIESLVKSGLASSNSEARRLLQAGAIYINGQKVERDNFEPGDFQNGRLLLRRGKAFKDSALVELE
jgi:tyrosyl-tRNA synthetase